MYCGRVTFPFIKGDEALNLVSGLRNVLKSLRHCNSSQDVYDAIYIYFNHEFKFVRQSSYYYDEHKKKVRIRSPFIDVIESDSYFVVLDEHSGEICPIFTLCECGHCEICTESKRNNWKLRCSLECQDHKKLPYFITLTYNNDHLPKDGELSKRDLNNFIHRFRKNLIYNYHYEIPFRLLKCGEYGGKRGRPHYHLLLWLDQDILKSLDALSEDIRDFKETQALTKTIRDSWSVRGKYDKKSKTFERIPIGYIFVEHCTNSDAGGYLGKYLTKFHTDNNPFIKHHQVKPFVIGTRKNGCIAKPWLLKIRCDFMKLRPNQTFFYHDKHSEMHELKQLPLNKWVLNMLIPSVSRLVDKPLRDLYRQYTFVVNKLQNHYRYEEITHFLEDYQVQPMHGVDGAFILSSKSHLSPDDPYRLMAFIVDATYQLFDADIDFELVNNISAFRDKYLSFYYQNRVPISLDDQKRKIQFRHACEQAKQQFKNDMQ